MNGGIYLSVSLLYMFNINLSVWGRVVAFGKFQVPQVGFYPDCFGAGFYNLNA